MKKTPIIGTTLSFGHITHHCCYGLDCLNSGDSTALVASRKNYPARVTDHYVRVDYWWVDL